MIDFVRACLVAAIPALLNVYDQERARQHAERLERYRAITARLEAARA